MKYQQKIISPFVACEIQQTINILYHISVLQVMYLPVCGNFIYVSGTHLVELICMQIPNASSFHGLEQLSDKSSNEEIRIEQSGSSTKEVPGPVSFYSHIYSIFQLTRHSVWWPRLLSLKHKIIFPLYLLFMSVTKGYIVRINMFIQISLGLRLSEQEGMLAIIWFKDLLNF